MFIAAFYMCTFSPVGASCARDITEKTPVGASCARDITENL